MVKEVGRVTTLTGRSGTEYEFSLWTFDEFDDIKGTFTGGGLYLFTNRHFVNGEYRHSYIYLGESGDYFNRYDNHHKESDIILHNANCIGFYSMPNSTEMQRKIAEEDLLAHYLFPCNIVNN